MTLYSIIGLFMRCISNTSMSDWKRQFPDIDYQLLIDFFKQNFEPQKIIENAWTFLFTIGNGWLILDEIVLEKSKEGKLRIVKRRYKSTGGYVTPALSLVLLLWSNGSIRVPIRFRVSFPENGSHIDMALNLLSWARNTKKLKPLYVIFDAGFAYERMFKRINDYGWCFVCKISKTRVLDGKQLWRYKQQGYWNDAGYLNCGIKVRAVRRADKFLVSNRIELSGNEIVEIYGKRAEIEEVFRVLKGACQWKKCQLSDDNRYERFLSIGVITFMCWEHWRISSFNPVTIYQLRRNVMFSHFKPRIPIPNYILEVSET